MRWKVPGQVMVSCVFPPRCPICGELRFPWESGTCTECAERLSYIQEPVCLACGREISSCEKEYCTECEKLRPVVERNFAVWQYDRWMKRSIADFKYEGRTEYAPFYARNIVQCYGARLKRLGVSVLVPVPCSKKRKRFRGYNQAEVLSGVLAKELDCKVCRLLRRTKDTLPQNALAPAERKKNLIGAFAWDERAAGELVTVPAVVAIVDDIYTTGNTMNSCAAVLKQHGVREVYGISVCVGGAR